MQIQISKIRQMTGNLKINFKTETPTWEHTQTPVLFDVAYGVSVGLLVYPVVKYTKMFAQYMQTKRPGDTVSMSEFRDYLWQNKNQFDEADNDRINMTFNIKIKDLKAAGKVALLSTHKQRKMSNVYKVL